MGAHPKAGHRRLALVLWALIAGFYFYLSYDYIRISFTDRRFAEYLDYVVQLGGTENRPANEVRALILVKAEELGLPVRGQQIEIKGGGTALSLSVQYGIDVEFPGLDRVLYHKEFLHTVKYHQMR